MDSHGADGDGFAVVDAYLGWRQEMLETNTT